MKLLKSLIIVCSAVGVYGTIKKYKQKKKPVRKKRIHPTSGNKYKQMPPAEVKQIFQQRIAVGEWLSPVEYAEMMEAIKE